MALSKSSNNFVKKLTTDPLAQLGIFLKEIAQKACRIQKPVICLHYHHAVFNLLRETPQRRTQSPRITFFSVPPAFCAFAPFNLCNYLHFQ